MDAEVMLEIEETEEMKETGETEEPEVLASSLVVTAKMVSP